MKTIVGTIAILILTGTYVALAAEIEVASSVNKTRVQIDEEISFTIRILGARGNLQAPRLPAFEGFDSFYTGRTSQFTFVNGKSESRVEFNFVLVPKVAGQFTLEPVQVWIEGKSYSTQPLAIEVLGPAVQVQPVQFAVPTRKTQVPPAPSPRAASPPSALPPTLIQDENVFVEATVNKPNVYPNEQVLLTYTLYTRYDTRYEGFEEEPSASGFWIEDFPLDRDLGRDTVTVRGKRYVKADVRKIALFATAPAEYTIHPGTLKVSIREELRTTSIFDEFFGDSFFSGSSFFAKRVERLLKPKPLALSVKPFPEIGKPASFNGAVGQFRLSASVDKNELKQNDPVTLKLVLEGEGNIETLSRPSLPSLTGFKIYEGDSSTQLFKTGNTLGGKKTFEVIFIPAEAGSLSIPPLEFSFFNPRSETYQVLQTQAFPLRVIPSDEPLRLPAELAQKEAFQKEVQIETKDIRYIHEEVPSERIERFQAFFYRALAGANLLGFLLVGNGLLRRRRETIFAQDVGLKRRSLARTLALRRIKPLRRLARSQRAEDAEQFVGEAEKVLNEYLSNQYNISAYHLTREWVEEKLSEVWGPEDSLLQRIRIFYDLANEARFGRGALPARERRLFLELIETVIRRLEK